MGLTSNFNLLKIWIKTKYGDININNINIIMVITTWKKIWIHNEKVELDAVFFNILFQVLGRDNCKQLSCGFVQIRQLELMYNDVTHI